jgi:flagellar motor component MotA
MARFIIGVVLLVVFLAGAILLEGGNLLRYIGISAFIVVFFPAVFAALAVWDRKALGQAFRDSLGKKAATDAARSARIWAFLERIFYLMGVLGWVIGVILILSHLNADTSRLFRGAASDFISPVYGIFFGIICRILHSRALARVKA